VPNTNSMISSGEVFGSSRSNSQGNFQGRDGAYRWAATQRQRRQDHSTHRASTPSIRKPFQMRNRTSVLGRKIRRRGRREQAQQRLHPPSVLRSSELKQHGELSRLSQQQVVDHRRMDNTRSRYTRVGKQLVAARRSTSVSKPCFGRSSSGCHLRTRNLSTCLLCHDGREADTSAEEVGYSIREVRNAAAPRPRHDLQGLHFSKQRGKRDSV
jgi:hypothetical protein